MNTILIVGGASGIGWAAAQALQASTHTVIVADINDAPTGTATVRLDLGNMQSVDAALSSITKTHGKIDAVVITAAVHSSYPFEFTSDALIDKVMDINLTGHMKFVRRVLPVLKDGGRIVAVSSIAAGIGIPMESLYSASKAGLELFYESLASEIAYRGIRCSVVQPGNVNTGFNEKGNDFKSCGIASVDANYKNVVARIDSKYGMSPADVAKDIVRALTSASPKMCYVTGPNAQKAHWARRILGRDLALKVMNKFFGMK